jgi:tetratricopeptide (TPR) repeat protein
MMNSRKWLLAYLLVFLTSLLAVAYGQKSSPDRTQPSSNLLEQHLRQAQSHLDQERYGEAIDELRKAIALNPSIPGAYYQLGYSHWKLGHFSEARVAFERELKFQPPDPYSHYYLGRIFLSEGQTAKATDQFEKVLTISPILDVYQQLGGAYLGANKLEQAIAYLQKAVELHPDQSDARYQLGRAYALAGRKSDAQREFELARDLKDQDQQMIRELTQCEGYLKQKKTEEALAIARRLGQSQDADLLLSLGMVLGRYGLHHEALAPLHRAASLRPSFFEAHFNIGVSLVASQDFAGAAESLEKAVKLNPESYDAQSLLGIAFAQQGKVDEAIPPLRKAVTIRNDNPRLLGLLGLKYTEARYYKEAVETLRKAISLQPNNSQFRFLLIQAHYLNQDTELALKEARQTLEAFPDLARSHFEVASQLQNMGRFQEVRPYLEKALAIDPGMAEAQIMLGEVLLKEGKVEESLSYFRAALQQHTDSIDAYVGLGKALLQVKRYDEAAKEMGKAIRINPEHPQPHLYLSQAYRGLGKRDEAAQQSEIFNRLNRRRMEQRDRETERSYNQP